MADVVVLVAAQAGEYRDHEATAPWTRPENEFVAPWGMFTTAEFALIARRHMHVYGTTREQLSIVAATIRNNGSQNPEAVYYQRGPFAPDGHHRVPSDRRAVSSAGLRHHLRRRVRAGGGQHRRRWTRPASRSTCWAAARTSTARRISIRPRGTWSGGAATTSMVWSAGEPPTFAFRARRAAARRRRRAGALRSVLLRDHPPARGFRILRRGRRRPVRRRRSHRDRRQPSGDDGRRNHVLQPRGRQSADDAARRSGRYSNCAARRARCKCPTRVLRCAATEERAPCSPHLLILGDEPL